MNMDVVIKIEKIPEEIPGLGIRFIPTKSHVDADGTLVIEDCEIVSVGMLAARAKPGKEG